MMKAIGYCRVSTEDQAENGESMEAQDHKIRQWCDLHDAELVLIRGDEGISGKSTHNRPALKECLDMAMSLRKAGDTVVFVIFALSRLSRSTRDTLLLADTFDKNRIELVSLTERIDTTTPAGKMFFTIMAAMNQYKIDETRVQTKAALDNKRRNGEALGNQRFGWMKDGVRGKLIPNEPELRAVKLMLELEASGHSLAEISAKLAERGDRARSGGMIDRSAVHRYLKFYHSDDGKQLLAQIGVA